MKAITLIQPWASLIVDGRKKIETRPWSASYRGPIAIHAGKKIDREACRRFGYDPETIATGAVLGKAWLRTCVRFPDAEAPPDTYGDFSAGRFGFILDTIIKFPEPIEARGSLNIWNWLPPWEN